MTAREGLTHRLDSKIRLVLEYTGPAAFARMLGLPLDTVQHWSSGRREPSAAAVQLIERMHARAYEYSGVKFAVLKDNSGMWVAFCAKGGRGERRVIAEATSRVKAWHAAWRWIERWLGQQEGGE